MTQLEATEKIKQVLVEDPDRIIQAITAIYAPSAAIIESLRGVVGPKQGVAAVLLRFALQAGTKQGTMDNMIQFAHRL